MRNLALSIPFGFQTRDRTKYGLLLPPDEIIPSGDEMWALHQLMAGNVIEEFDADSLDVSGIADRVDDDEDESDEEAATWCDDDDDDEDDNDDDNNNDDDNDKDDNDAKDDN